MERFLTIKALEFIHTASGMRFQFLWAISRKAVLTLPLGQSVMEG